MQKAIKNLIFDFGGVVTAQSYEKAVCHFEEVGVKDARKILDPHTQTGLFGDLENGSITAEHFRLELSRLIGKELTVEDCVYACTGYVEQLPKKNLENLLKLKADGYRMILLSNTNPYMMMWALSDKFDGEGHSLRHYFDAIYLSYETHLMKPSVEAFSHVLAKEQIGAEETIFVDDSERNVTAAATLGIHTLCPKNNQDWGEDLQKMLTY